MFYALIIYEKINLRFVWSGFSCFIRNKCFLLHSFVLLRLIQICVLKSSGKTQKNFNILNLKNCFNIFFLGILCDDFPRWFVIKIHENLIILLRLKSFSFSFIYQTHLSKLVIFGKMSLNQVIGEYEWFPHSRSFNSVKFLFRVLRSAWNDNESENIEIALEFIGKFTKINISLKRQTVGRWKRLFMMQFRLILHNQMQF